MTTPPNDKAALVPINKGNYSMDSNEREAAFEANRGDGWEEAYAQYRSDWTHLAKTQTVSEWPLLVDLELASVCNLRCPMCYTISEPFKEKVNAKLMDWDLYRRIIDEIGGKVTALRLSLRGEATLHKHFIEAIRYAKDRGIKEISTLTHGGKLNEDFFAQMVDAGIDWITISIDGLGEQYEAVRKPLKFDEQLDRIKAMHAYKQARGLKRPVIKVQSIWPAIRENPQAYYDVFSPYTDLVAFNPLIDYLGNDNHIQYMDDFICPQQYQRLVIGADGLVMKCSNDEENQEVIGDASQESVYQIWHGEKMNAVRAMLQKPQGFQESPVCRKCYLPRLTEDEEAQVCGRRFLVKNYVARTQTIGK